MSKSLGNFFTIQEILGRHEAAALRHYFLSSHYRSPLDFSEQGLEEASKGVERIYETIERLDRALPSDGDTAEPETEILNTFRQEMDDDFNTPKAMALIFDEVRALNRILDGGKTKGLAARGQALKVMGEVLGLLQEKPALFLKEKRGRWLRKQGISVESIEEAIRRRERARSEKKWQEADRIRKELQERGIMLEDTPGGTIWKVR